MNGYNNGFQGGQPNPQNNPNDMMPSNWNMPSMPPPWMWNPWAFFSGGGNQQSGFSNSMNQSDNNQRTVQNEQNNAMTNQPNNQNAQNQVRQRQSVPCGIVGNENEIKPGEVPMDGGFGMFIKSDASEIYIKQWGSDGKINTKTFVESMVDDPQGGQSNGLTFQTMWDNVDARLGRIEELIANLSQPQPMGGNRQNNKKKEVVNNG